MMRVLNILLLVATSLITYSQNKEEVITVQAFVGGPHQSVFQNNSNDTSYTAIGIVRNNQDTAISFLIMEKSWFIDNWITDNENILRDFNGWSLNSKKEIKLLPHQSIQFSFELVIRKNVHIKESFKLGFMFSDNPFSSTQIPIEERIKKEKIYWSNSLTLADKTLFHKIL